MKSQKVPSGFGPFRKTDSKPLFVSRRVVNLFNYQTALVEVLRKIFLLAQISGVLPLILRDNKVQFWFVLLLFSSVIQLVMSTKIFYETGKLFLDGVSSTNTTLLIDDSGALSYAEEAGKTIIVLYIIISTSTFCTQRHLFARIIRRLTTVKILLSQCGLSCRIRPKWQPLLLHAPIAFAALVELISAETVDTAVSLTSKYTSEIMFGSIIVFFIQLLYLVEGLLAFINDHLLKLSTLNQSENYRKITTMSDCHHYLCSVCYFINSLHSFPLVFLFLSTFIKLVVLVFKTFVVLSTLSLKQVVIFGAVLASYVARSWYVVYICARTSDQTKLFNKTLFEMMLFESSGEETIYVKKLMLHLGMKREIEFHAKGFFTVDYPLLHSIAAVATSYLVILVQTTGK